MDSAPAPSKISLRTVGCSGEIPDRGSTMIAASTIHLLAALIGALAILTLALAVFLPQAAQRPRSGSDSANRSTLSSLTARIPISEIRDDLIVRRDGSFL